MKFSAVILAGGKSSRMGRDKALLEADGQPLLARQIQLVRDAGADEVFISGRADADYAAFACPVLRDDLADIGPLAGIERALQAVANPLVLVLAVDMPEMTRACLRHLLARAEGGGGAIPRLAGRLEPLAAFYPKPSLAILKSQLAAEQKSATGFAVACVAAGLATFVDLPESDARFFVSWNSPADLPCLK